MEGSVGAAEGSADDHAGKKKSRFKLLKSRLFGRLKRKENQSLMKLSQSAGDVGAREGGEGLSDSEEDCLDPAGSLGSRALSHDSIFLSDPALTPAEPARVLSQENVHGKIRALQLKLQQQNMRLGPPPPLLIPGKRMEDSGATSEDDGLPQSPPDTAFHERAGPRSPSKLTEFYRHHSTLSLAGTGSEEDEQWSSQPSSRPLSPATPSLACPASSSSSNQEVSSAVDLSSPLQYEPSLDNSAARHRMSVKPRNQRASAKGRKGPPRVSRPRSESLSDLDLALPEGEEDREPEGEPNAEPDRELEGESTAEPDREPEGEPNEEPDKEPDGEPRREEERGEEEETEKATGSLPQEQLSSSASGRDGVLVEPPAGGEEVLQRETSSEPERKVTHNPLFLQTLPQEPEVLSAQPRGAKSPESICPTPTPSCPTPTPSLKAVEEPLNPTKRAPSQPALPHTMPSHGKREVLACLEQGSRSLSQKRPSASLKSGDSDSTRDVRELSSRGNSGQISGQISGQTSGQTSGLTSGLTSAQTSGQTSGLTSGLTSGQTSGLTSGQTSGLTAGQTSISSERLKPAPRSGGTARPASARTKGSPPERSAGATSPSAGQDEELPVDTVKEREDVEGLGSSHRFSVSSARHRSRNERGGRPGARQEQGEREAGGSQPGARQEREGGGGGERLPVKKTCDQRSIRRQEVKPVEEQEVNRKCVEEQTRQGSGSSRPPKEGRGGLDKEEVVLGEGGRQREEQKHTEMEAAMVTGQSEEVEEEEEERGRRGAFGVKLRPTSQSVKHRSETGQSEYKIKRHSIEVMATEPEPIRKEDEASSKVVRQAGEPVWMSVAREKSRSLQQHLSAQLPSDVPQETHTLPGGATLPRLPPRLTSILPPSTLPSSSSIVQVRNRRSLGDRWSSSPSETESGQSTDGTEAGKAATLSTKSEAPSSSSSSLGTVLSVSPLPETHGDQPSWMEVARKKAMAWNIKTMD